MRHLNALLVVGVLGLGCLRASAGEPGAMLQPRKFSARISRTATLDYLLFLPSDYGKPKSRRWPLLLFLHGAGERGTNLWLVAKHGPPKILPDRPDFPFILVAPQCPEGRVWDTPELIALLDDVTHRYKVDKSRVYLTGLSMGGYGTWSLGLARPERFAAIAPICGGGDPIAVLLASPVKLAALRSLPVWVFHGGKDPVVKLEESERMVKALRQAGAKEVELTVYPDAGHDSWTETYNNPKLWDWFLQHQRK